MVIDPDDEGLNPISKGASYAKYVGLVFPASAMYGGFFFISQESAVGLFAGILCLAYATFWVMTNASAAVVIMARNWILFKKQLQGKD